MIGFFIGKWWIIGVLCDIRFFDSSHWFHLTSAMFWFNWVKYVPEDKRTNETSTTFDTPTTTNRKKKVNSSSSSTSTSTSISGNSSRNRMWKCVCVYSVAACIQQTYNYLSSWFLIRAPSLSLSSTILNICMFYTHTYTRWRTRTHTHANVLYYCLVESR